MVVKVAMGENFSASHYHSNSVPYSLFSSYYFHQKDERPKHRSFGRRQALEKQTLSFVLFFVSKVLRKY